MKRIPLWGKYCIFYMIGIFITISIIVTVVMYKTYTEKRDIINTFYRGKNAWKFCHNIVK